MSGKPATVRDGGRALWGAVEEDGFVALSPDFPEWRTLTDVVRAGAVEHVMRADDGRRVTHHAGGFLWDIRLPDPGKIICVGMNFPDRNADNKDGQDVPPNMSLFIRFVSSFVGHGAALVRPPESVQPDYEGEIAVVIGKAGRRIPQVQALDHIAALTLCNDGTIRDWVRHAKFNLTQGKNGDRSGAMGPRLVPFRAATQIEDVAPVTRVNGEVRQQDHTGRMLFPVARQIACISTFCRLEPGGIIVTGTRFDPPVWLRGGGGSAGRSA